MKKSDMLKVITDKLFYGKLAEAARSEARPKFITDLAEEDAEAVLKELEKFGMLPPLSDETIGQHNVSTIESMLDSVMYDFKWDKEDETI